MLLQGWLLSTILAVYLLVANVLLINLLVAMMNSTYSKVASESLQVWSQRQIDSLDEFVYKYDSTGLFLLLSCHYPLRRNLPAPFNALTNILWFVKRSFQGSFRRSAKMRVEPTKRLHAPGATSPSKELHAFSVLATTR
jgi:hypothetical protein